MDDRSKPIAHEMLLQPSRASPGIDAGEARGAFEAMQPRLLALKPAELIKVRVDPQRAAAIAYSVAVRDRVPARRAVFERLSVAGLYDVDVLETMPDVAQTVWYTRQQPQVGRVEAQRAVTRLLRTYDEHRVAGQFAFRRSEDVAVTYPSLITAVRSAPSRRGRAGDDEPGEPGDADV
ncbi:MAG TPA: hypothetical protein VFS43_38140 [Polyangiaceae bacterium]|nr:hypothetical protein [Polyangiaceae bacterium]